MYRVHLFTRSASRPICMSCLLIGILCSVEWGFAQHVSIVEIGGIVAPSDSVDLRASGNVFDKLRGKVFEDENENGRYDPGENGLEQWSVRIYSSASETLLTTDWQGEFQIDGIRKGRFFVGLPPRFGWDQIYPTLRNVYSISLYNYGQIIENLNFAVHKIPPRVKSALSMNDSRPASLLEIYFGIRDGATEGIWGVDERATRTDYAEGERELPPLLTGLFDARFEHPRGSVSVYGQGSRVDMRDYRSPSQVDTYRVRFMAGELEGGGYPVTFSWSADRMRSLYQGPVTLTYSGHPPIDMRSEAEAVITNVDVNFLTIICAGPVLETVGVDEEQGRVPSAAFMLQNYPNPFNPATTITYRVDRVGEVTLNIVDMNGRLVQTLVDGNRLPGEYETRWDASAYPSGIYFATIRTAASVHSRKMLLIK